MYFRQLKAFLTVAETGNMTRAAELLHVVQPAISRQIRLLEEDLGTVLFERKRHGMILTEAGRSLVEYGHRIMLELDRARLELQSSEVNVSGLVTIGLLPSTGETLSCPLVNSISQLYPGIQLRIVTGYAGTLLRWLEIGEVDAALLYGAERSTEIKTTPLVEEALWVIGSPTSQLRSDESVSLSTLTKEQFIMPSTHHGIRILVDHACNVANIRLNLSVEANALNVQRSLVLGGHGLTILPPSAVAKDLEEGRLLGAPICEPDITRTIVLALSSSRSNSRPVRGAVKVLIETMRHTIEKGEWLEGYWLAS